MMGSAYELQKIWQCNISKLWINDFSIIHFGFERIQGSPEHNFLPTVTVFKYKNLPAVISPHKQGNLPTLRPSISKKNHKVAMDVVLQKNCEIIILFKINCLGGLEHLMSPLHHMHVSKR